MITAATPILFPESSFPLTSGRKTRALGTIISGVCIFRPLVKQNKDSGNKLAATHENPINSPFTQSN